MEACHMSITGPPVIHYPWNRPGKERTGARVRERDGGGGRRGRTLPRCKAFAPRPRPPQPPRALLRAPPPPNRQRQAAALRLLLDLRAAAARRRRIHGRAAPGLPHQRRHLPRRPIPHQGKRAPSLEPDPAPLRRACAGYCIVSSGFISDG